VRRHHQPFGEPRERRPSARRRAFQRRAALPGEIEDRQPGEVHAPGARQPRPDQPAS
jgi:hypothetical protein